MAAKGVSRHHKPNTGRYGREKIDRRGGRTLTGPNRITTSGKGLQKR